MPLGATLMALKSSYAVRAGQAQRAVVAGRASYAHRLTADRDLLQPPSLGYGYFDFRTPPAAPALHTNDAFAEYASGGFLQWSPVREAAPTLHLAAADQASGRLLLLDRLQLGALTTEAMGRLEVRQDGLRALGSSEFDGKLSLRGQLKVEQPAAGLAGHGQ
ncbi:MAG: hypothetical protein FJ125_06340, partial [Deltaproteobacteria bacterium]|nr:hypothetical protein [Deltaproteobacteria bacterium]